MNFHKTRTISKYINIITKYRKIFLKISQMSFDIKTLIIYILVYILNNSIKCYCDHQLLEGSLNAGARCSSVVRALAHGVMGRRIDPS